MAIEILAAPNLRTSYMKIAERLKELDHDSLFLNFPENLKPLIRDLVKNRLSYRAFIEEIRKRKLVPEPIDGWRYTAEPLLKSLIEGEIAQIRSAALLLQGCEPQYDFCQYCWQDCIADVSGKYDR